MVCTKYIRSLQINQYFNFDYIIERHYSKLLDLHINACSKTRLGLRHSPINPQVG
jgi:hypothetical protein